ncbi:MAG: diaminopimelate epimerase [Proteobacteria bacterium]|nr:diaminopimelate epimerase [Pseudomonadota bacterium]
MNELSFTKMHGLGNDFVVLDARRQPVELDQASARAISDRRSGIGCDQILVIEAAADSDADIFMRILNADGSESAACGNGARCVAALMMAETGNDKVRIETKAGLLSANAAEDGYIAVDMGEVHLDWRAIPLSKKADTLHLDVTAGMLSDAVGVNVGNPHAVFFVDDAAAVPLQELGPQIENHALFPQRVNVEVAQILRGGSIRMRVWERGVGITRACGSGACATVVAASRRELSGRSSIVILDGGALGIEWQEDNHIIMIGPVATSYAGVIDPSLLA